MKKAGWLLTMCFILFAAGLHAGENVFDRFAYDADKVDVGNIYHYIITNFKESDSVDFYFYIKSNDTIEGYQDFSGISPMVVETEMIFDWEHMMLKKIRAENPFRDAKLPNTSDISYGEWDYNRKKMVLQWTQYDAKGVLRRNSKVITANILPTYDVSFYHVEFWFALRFLINKTKSFLIGSQFTGFYMELDVAYKGDETVDGVLCEKYQMNGQGLLSLLNNVKASVWIARDDKRRYTVRYENHMKVFPFDNLRLKLESIKTISYDEWKTFVKDRNEAAAKLIGIDLE